MQSTAHERLHDQIIEEIKEMEHKKTEEASNLVKKENDLWRYQNVKEEAKRMQGARKPRTDEEMAWAPPRNNSTGLIGKRREVEKRRCQRSLSCRMRPKALSWTLMAKAIACRQKQKILEEKEKHQATRVRR